MEGIYNMYSIFLKVIFLFIIFICELGANNVITCGDALKVDGEAKAVLHKIAQKRAQEAFENLVGKKLKNPTADPMDITILGIKEIKSNPVKFATWIETFWCEATNTPLHEAYFRYYTSIGSDPITKKSIFVE